MTPESKETITFLAQLVSQLGFPVVVAGYLLWRIHPALVALTKAIEALRGCLEHASRRVL